MIEGADGGGPISGEAYEALSVAEKLARIRPIDPEAVEASLRRRREHRAALAALPGFAPFSLEDWLSLCAKAGVEAVPSTVVARIPMEVLCGYDHDPAYAAAMSEAEGALEALKAARRGERLMTRWDGCGDMWLKIAMTDGDGWGPERAAVPCIDEERAFETHAIHMPKADVPIHVRPWVEAERIDGHPLEFRAYVEGGRVVGVSNYHYQRPLPAEPRLLALARRCATLAGRLVAAQDLPVRLTTGPDDVADPAVNAWTADFIVTPDRGPLFLEGGPPPAYRASRCCFGGRAATEGIALSPDGPVVALSPLGG